MIPNQVPYHQTKILQGKNIRISDESVVNKCNDVSRPIVKMSRSSAPVKRSKNRHKSEVLLSLRGFSDLRYSCIRSLLTCTYAILPWRHFLRLLWSRICIPPDLALCLISQVYMDSFVSGSSWPVMDEFTILQKHCLGVNMIMIILQDVVSQTIYHHQAFNGWSHIMATKLAKKKGGTRNKKHQAASQHQRESNLVKSLFHPQRKSFWVGFLCFIVGKWNPDLVEIFVSIVFIVLQFLAQHFISTADCWWTTDDWLTKVSVISAPS